MASDTDHTENGAAEEDAAPKRPSVTRVEHFTPAERAARGKATRAEVPRTSHGAWEPALHRPDPVELLEEQAQTRVPELVPIRYGRMLVSPFTFYRGAAYLMASDLAAGPRTGLHTQLCGDAHLSNFGGFAAPDRKLVFSLNDFDETLPGPFEWDVKRLAASFAVAGRDRGFDEAQRAVINQEVGKSYRENIREFAAMRNLDIWYSRIDVDDLVARVKQEATAKDSKAEKRLEANVAKGRTKDSMKAFSKLTTIVDGEPRITGDPPSDRADRGRRRRSGDRLRRVPPHASFARIGARWPATAASCSSATATSTPPARSSASAASARAPGSASCSAATTTIRCSSSSRRRSRPCSSRSSASSEFANSGQRVVEGQRLTQAASDIMLGWIKIEGVDGVKRDFYIRQLWDAKMSAMVEFMEPRGMAIYAHVCGRELARAHARAGDGIAIASYLGNGDTFDRAIAQFAETYADQNERDYAALKTAVEVGRVHAEFGL